MHMHSSKWTRVWKGFNELITNRHHPSKWKCTDALEENGSTFFLLKMLSSGRELQAMLLSHYPIQTTLPFWACSSHTPFSYISQFCKAEDYQLSKVDPAVWSPTIDTQSLWVWVDLHILNWVIFLKQCWEAGYVLWGDSGKAIDFVLGWLRLGAEMVTQ